MMFRVGVMPILVVVVLLLVGCEKISTASFNDVRIGNNNETGSSVSGRVNLATIDVEVLNVPTIDRSVMQAAVPNVVTPLPVQFLNQIVPLNSSISSVVTSLDAIGSRLAISASNVIIASKTLVEQPATVIMVNYNSVTDVWKDIELLQVQNISVESQFGKAIAIKNDIALISAPGLNDGQGAVFGFQDDSKTGLWSKSFEIVPQINIDAEIYSFGDAIAFNGQTIAISGFSKNISGKIIQPYIYMYGLHANEWVLDASISLDEDFMFDRSLALIAMTDDTLIVSGSNINGVGKVDVYNRIGSSWSQSSSLIPKETDITSFGAAVAINGKTLLISSINEFNNTGSVNIYQKDIASSKWILQQVVQSSDSTIQFGRSLGIVGDLIYIGASSKTENNGIVYTLQRQNNRWVTLNILTPALADNKSFGAQLVASHKALIVAATGKKIDQNFSGEITSLSLLKNSLAGLPASVNGQIDVNINAFNQIPDDPDLFLTLVTQNSPIIVESAESARAYYTAVDPLNRKTTLNRWRREVGFTRNDPAAVYTNAADLGFSRRMFSRINTDGSIASYVKNYANLRDAANNINVIATVAMEVAPPALNPLGEPFVSFYVFGPDGRRDLGADLDGQGFKFQPGLCSTCHGGVTSSLVNGQFPNGGDIGALFLPYDLDTYEYINNSRQLSRAAQEPNLKRLNEIVLASYDLVSSHIDTSSPRSLIEGWYGGVNLPNQTFDGSFVPEGWLPPAAPVTAAQLYIQTIGPKCRACHVQRGLILQSDLDFGTFDKFLSFSSAIEETVFKKGVMPLAKLTFENFWSDPVNAQLIAEHLPNFSSFSTNAIGVEVPGQPVANAGVSRVAALQRRVRLNANASLFAASVRWRISSAPPGSNVVLSNNRSRRPSFTPDVAGEYEFKLVVSNRDRVSSAPSFVIITASTDISPVSFSNDIVPILQSEDCLICHIDPAVRNFADNQGLYQSIFELVNFTDPTSSIIVSKASGIHHNARGRPGFVEPDTSDRQTVLRWIAEGAKNN